MCMREVEPSPKPTAYAEAGEESPVPELLDQIGSMKTGVISESVPTKTEATNVPLTEEILPVPEPLDQIESMKTEVISGPVPAETEASSFI